MAESGAGRKVRRALGQPLSLVREEVATEAPLFMTAREVAALLRIAPKKVYELPLPRVALSPRRIRWNRNDVLDFVQSRRVA